MNYFPGNSTRWSPSIRQLVLLTYLFHRSLIIASEYDPYSIVDKLAPYLGGSASIVVHSPHIQVCLIRSRDSCVRPISFQILSDLQTKMRAFTCYLCPTVTEGWLRRYQVFAPRMLFTGC